VLDIASGTGALSVQLADQMQQQKCRGTVLATDFAPAMVEVLQQKAASKALRNMNCQVMDGQVQNS
jgi:ubiquinone/menaquinone biosynthesis C-methylase UbiE